jgi:hypothetical protein
VDRAATVRIKKEISGISFLPIFFLTRIYRSRNLGRMSAVSPVLRNRFAAVRAGGLASGRPRRAANDSPQRGVHVMFRFRWIRRLFSAPLVNERTGSGGFVPCLNSWRIASFRLTPGM